MTPQVRIKVQYFGSIANLKKWTVKLPEPGVVVHGERPIPDRPDVLGAPISYLRLAVYAVTSTANLLPLPKKRSTGFWIG